MLVGLTGGIAAGKTTVAEVFAELGAGVVDADRLAREVTAPGAPALVEIVRVFGHEVLGADGSLDRAALGRRVFVDPAERAKLEAITHPAIAAASAARLEQLRDAGAPLLIYEAALLVETGRYRQMDRLVVVTATEEVRVARLMARNGFTRADALARLAAQLPEEEKVRVADYVVDNSGALAETRRQVEAVWRALTQTEKTT
ncbi:MAG: dephospho-CoA kinase [Deltaproteobacteria bacterium]|nr:dephospho-CoA kinase [Deltaproteobacteria bacterium]